MGPLVDIPLVSTELAPSTTAKTGSRTELQATNVALATLEEQFASLGAFVSVLRVLQPDKAEKSHYHLLVSCFTLFAARQGIHEPIEWISWTFEATPYSCYISCFTNLLFLVSTPLEKLWFLFFQLLAPSRILDQIRAHN